MALSLVTGPAAEPVSLVEAKLHLRVDTTAEDDLIAGLIVAAREYAETFTHRAIPPQTFDDVRCGFPYWHEPIWIDKAPAISVTSVTYIDQDGVSTVWSSTLYTTDLPYGPKARKGCIWPAYQQQYPQTRNVPNAVTVRYRAGYTATALTLATLTQAAGLATATVTAGHGLANLTLVTVAGAAQAGYNGTFTATVTSATTFTFPVAAATVSPATGTVTATPSPFPNSLTAAMKILIATWYGPAREGIAIGNIVNAMPMAVDALLWAYKSF